MNELATPRSILVFDDLAIVSASICINPKGHPVIIFDNVKLYQEVINSHHDQSGSKEMHRQIIELHKHSGLIDIAIPRERSPAVNYPTDVEYPLPLGHI